MISNSWMIIAFWGVPALVTIGAGEKFFQLRGGNTCGTDNPNYEHDIAGLIPACIFGWPVVVIVMICKHISRRMREGKEKASGLNTTSFNPIKTGFPTTLKKEYWEHPSKTVGREFETPDGMYYVVSWTPLDHGTDAGDDTLEDAGTMTVERCVAD
jgi:hypothetical protein